MAGTAHVGPAAAGTERLERAGLDLSGVVPLHAAHSVVAADYEAVLQPFGREVALLFGDPFLQAAVRHDLQRHRQSPFNALSVVNVARRPERGQGGGKRSPSPRHSSDWSTRRRTDSGAPAASVARQPTKPSGRTMTAPDGEIPYAPGKRPSASARSSPPTTWASSGRPSSLAATAAASCQARPSGPVSRTKFRPKRSSVDTCVPWRSRKTCGARAPGRPCDSRGCSCSGGLPGSPAMAGEL